MLLPSTHIYSHFQLKSISVLVRLWHFPLYYFISCDLVFEFCAASNKCMQRCIQLSLLCVFVSFPHHSVHRTRRYIPLQLRIQIQSKKWRIKYTQRCSACKVAFGIIWCGSGCPKSIVTHVFVIDYFYYIDKIIHQYNQVSDVRLFCQCIEKIHRFAYTRTNIIEEEKNSIAFINEKEEK